MTHDHVSAFHSVSFAQSSVSAEAITSGPKVTKELGGKDCVGSLHPSARHGLQCGAGAKSECVCEAEPSLGGLPLGKVSRNIL